MSKTAIVTDSNSGITPAQAKELGVYVIPMPFMIDGDTYFEFYQKMSENADISTSQPSPESVLELWDSLLKEYDEIVHIPMSSGLSGSCSTAYSLSLDYDGKVVVVDNQRISVTQRQSVLDAVKLAEMGKNAQEIHDILMANAMESSIYIMVDTLTYLKKGGRITPAAAALGTLLKLKPVLQIQGEKLDAFAKARTVKLAKSIMIKQVLEDAANRYGVSEPGKLHISMAYTPGTEDKTAAIEEFKKEVQATFPGHDIVVNPLSLSVSCHIGPGALAVTATKAIEI